MKAYRFRTGTTLEPFGDPVGDAFLGGETLKQAVERALAAAGIPIEEVSGSDALPAAGEYLLLSDTLFLTFFF